MVVLKLSYLGNKNQIGKLERHINKNYASKYAVLDKREQYS